MIGICVALIVLTIGTSKAWAAGQKATQQTPLNATGQELLKRYEDMLAELKANISKALPKVNEQKNAAYVKARDAEKAAEAGVKATQQRMGEIDTAKALVGHAKEKWIGEADKGIAAAKAKFERAATQADRQAAQQELVKWQKNREDGVAALKERQAALDKVERERPNLEKELVKAQKALVAAKAETLKAVEDLGLKSFLSSNKLDNQLAKFLVLSEATPLGLAEFAQQGKKQEKLIEQLLADADLMLQMAVADGAEEGNYAQAMEIYTAIQKASKKANYGVLQRLALAVSLEHAVPVQQRNAVGLTNAPANVDPVNRYLHYEKACLGGELDPGFNDLTAWDLRMVVDGNEPDEILAWGREMLHNYRPDHIYTSDYRWRYVAVVRTDCKYGSQDNKYDKPELQFFQNILMNGGVCGRRAFFGRFILRSFGVPTTARPQRGHAALAHWTPDGWVVCLGGRWGVGWANGPTKGRNNGRNSDLDFLAITQARNTGKPYMQVKRAQWVGDVLGEKRVAGFLSGDPDFWYAMSFYRQSEIIEEAKAVTLAAVGEELGEANESKVKYAIESATVTEADRKIVFANDGLITIPAVACSKPTKSTGKIIFMPSNLGGKQLHYNRTGKPEQFEYTFDAPAAGIYTLAARVVTPSWNQHLLLTVNDATKPIDIALPFTIGMWDKTEPVEVTLVKGQNVLRFSREEPVKGLTIKDFTLKALK